MKLLNFKVKKFREKYWPSASYDHEFWPRLKMIINQGVLGRKARLVGGLFDGSIKDIDPECLELALRVNPCLKRREEHFTMDGKLIEQESDAAMCGG